ncbi:MAG: cytosine deaminase [Synergistaceae bacterium]|jgi:cytosine deaminase|nr:cytosine deaminase [Synergistaceae bacterium]
MDMVLRNARIRRSAQGEKKGGDAELFDVGIKDGKIAAIEPNISLKGEKEIDVSGNLLTPPFIDPHLHLDAVLSVGDPRYNESGTLLEGIKIWGERKKNLVKEEILRNARETASWQIAQGVLHVRTHADVSDPAMLPLEALLELKDELRGLIDLQIVAFPQDGVYTWERGEALMIRAMEMGADVVGGIPHNELTREDGVRDVEFAFKLAERFGKMIDIHCDETGDDQSRFVEVAAKCAIASGMGSRVSLSHTTSMHNFNNDYALKLMGILRRAKMNFITNPFDNSVLQNRTDGYPRRRGHTRVDELCEAGVNVSIGHDSIMDPWYPMGRGNMLEAANLLMHTAHMSGYNQIKTLFDMITSNSAVTMGLGENYGIEAGRRADMVILDASTEFEAVRLKSECLFVIREGRVISRATPAERIVNISGVEKKVDFKR